jgi:hypothetical protein
MTMAVPVMNLFGAAISAGERTAVMAMLRAALESDREDQAAIDHSGAEIHPDRGNTSP